MLIEAKCFPCIESTRGYLTYIAKGRRLSSSGGRDGTMNCVEHRRASEEWTIEQNGLLSSRQGLLCVNKEGSIAMVNSLEEEDVKHVDLCQLRLSKDGTCQIIASQSGQVVVCNSNYELELQPSENSSRESSSSTSSTSWRLELLSGELCYLSNVLWDKRICCDIFGKLHPVDNRSGAWEIWRMVEAGDGTVLINSWTHSEKVLCSNPDGRVYTSENKLGDWEKWRPEKGEKGVLLRSVAHDRLLSLAGRTFCTTFQENASCCWIFDPANRNTFSLSTTTATGRRHFLSPQKGKNAVEAVNKKSNKRTEWRIEFVDDEFVTLQHSQDNVFLNAHPDGVVSTSKGPHMWTLAATENGMELRSLYDEVLCCDTDGNISLSRDSSTSTIWTLVPSLPFAPNARQVWTLAGAGVASVALVAVAPMCVTGVIGAFGFGAEGIAAGSVAAGMMSAEAIAGGGAIAAGGTVATLQSIGAAGLGIAGTSAAMGGGALIGGAVVGTTGAVVLRNSTETEIDVHEGDDDDFQPTNRPFAAWEYWQ